jgi:hypothetical protein
MIKQKPKKCKGTGKANGYGCGTLQLIRHYGLGVNCKCYQNWLLQTEEGRQVIEKRRISASKKLKAEKKKESREFKEKNKSIAKLKQEARKVFQQWIRIRDVDLLCVCCGQNSETWDAGHYYKAELYSGVIFHEMNVNKQRVYCNKHLHGNEGEYRKGLIEKYGEDAVKELDRIAIETKDKEWSREELLEIKKHYQLKIKECLKH